ncbi:MAG TPA: CoA-binding protein [Opitutaceae bacterium]|nr:CoA-binding protein [Opitutaceae bacterium]
MTLLSSRNDEELRKLFIEIKTIAVVGLSHDAAKPSHEVAAYLQKAGYRIIPINPEPGLILGEAVYPTLADVPVQVDLVDVFRRAEACAEVVRQAVPLKPRAIWLQLGIVSKEAAQIANDAGVPFVMDRCTKIDHQRLLGKRMAGDKG